MHLHHYGETAGLDTYFSPVTGWHGLPHAVSINASCHSEADFDFELGFRFGACWDENL